MVYDYLNKAGREYLLRYQVFRQGRGRNFTVLLWDIECWVDEPYRLFQSYSLHYFKPFPPL